MTEVILSLVASALPLPVLVLVANSLMPRRKLSVFGASRKTNFLCQESEVALEDELALLLKNLSKVLRKFEEPSPASQSHMLPDSSECMIG